MAQNRPKMTSFHLFVHPKWFKIRFGKTRVSPLFDLFFCPRSANFQAILPFSGGKNGPPRTQNRLEPLVLAYHVVQDKL